MAATSFDAADARPDARRKLAAARRIAPGAVEICELPRRADGAAGLGDPGLRRRPRQRPPPVGNLAVVPGMHRLHRVGHAPVLADVREPDLRPRLARLPRDAAGGVGRGGRSRRASRRWRTTRANMCVVVDGAIPAKDGGVYSTIAGQTNLDMLKDTAKDALAVVAVGSCASFGGIPKANPEPDRRRARFRVRHRQAGDQHPRLPADRRGDGRHDRLHDRVRQAARTSTSSGARKRSTARRSTTAATGGRSTSAANSPTVSTTRARGAAIACYKVGCKGPVTYNSCATLKWNGGVSLPDPVRSRLPRLFRTRLLGPGRLLSAAVGAASAISGCRWRRPARPASPSAPAPPGRRGAIWRTAAREPTKPEGGKA